MPVPLVQEDAPVSLAFRRTIKNIGRAYHTQATEMIRICRLLAEVSQGVGLSLQSEKLSNVFKNAQEALNQAVSAGKEESEAATYAFKMVEESLERYMQEYHPGQITMLGDVHVKFAKARETDTNFMKLRNRLVRRLGFNPASPFTTSLVRQNFLMLRSPSLLPDRANILTSHELDPKADLSEILWIFSRSKGDSRITLKQNPHFYDHVPQEASSFNSKFRLDPLKAKFTAGKLSMVYIIIDRQSRIFLEYGKLSRTFGNIWKPRETIILKDVRGALEAADIVEEPIKKTPAAFWRRGETTLMEVEVANDWNSLLHHALVTDNVDFLVRPVVATMEPLPTKKFLPYLPVRETTGSIPTGSTAAIGSTTTRSGSSLAATRSHTQATASSTSLLSSSSSSRLHRAAALREGSATASGSGSTLTLVHAPEDVKAAPVHDAISQISSASLAPSKPSLDTRDSGISVSETGSFPPRLRAEERSETASRTTSDFLNTHAPHISEATSPTPSRETARSPANQPAHASGLPLASTGGQIAVEHGADPQDRIHARGGYGAPTELDTHPSTNPRSEGQPTLPPIAPKHSNQRVASQATRTAELRPGPTSVHASAGDSTPTTSARIEQTSARPPQPPVERPPSTIPQFPTRNPHPAISAAPPPPAQKRAAGAMETARTVPATSDQQPLPSRAPPTAPPPNPSRMSAVPQFAPIKPTPVPPPTQARPAGPPQPSAPVPPSLASTSTLVSAAAPQPDKRSWFRRKIVDPLKSALS